MTPRELVIKTLEFDSPERIPRQLWWLPWAKVYYLEKLQHIQSEFPDDIISSPGFYTKLSKNILDSYEWNGASHKKGFFTDEWGCTFLNIQDGIIGEVKDPFVKDLGDYDKIILPEDYLHIDIVKVNDFCRNSNKFVLAGLTGGNQPRPFERLQFLRGTENLYIDLIEQPSELMNFIKRMHEFNLKVLELWGKTDVDALNFMDDWGSQKSLLISPKLWREIFKPLYKDYVDIAHKNNKYIFMHSDGYILDIIPDLIEIGVDVLNSQLFCMEVENLKQFKGKITFWGEIDRQWLLPNGTKQQISEAVRLVYDTLYQNGGVIAQCEFGAGTNPDNVYQVFKTWDEL
jgi:hypothetical protein